MRKDFLAEVETVESLIRRRLPIGTIISEKRLVDDFISQVRRGHPGTQIARCCGAAPSAHWRECSPRSRRFAALSGWRGVRAHQNFSKYAVEKALALMLQKDDLAHRNQGRSVVRIR